MRYPLWCLTAVLAAGPACTVNVGGSRGPAERPGATIRESKSVERSKAEMVDVEIRLGAGELNIQGGARGLMDAEFSYNIASWQPEVHYEDAGFRGRLSVKQGAGSATMGKAVNEWHIRLADEVPVDLTVICGAGENKLDLRGLNLRSVNTKIGAGSVEIDLRAEHHRDFEVNVEGGVGEATIWLPRGIPIEASAKGGLGKINVTGLTRAEDGVWVSDVRGKDKPAIRVTAKGGIGEINIYAE
jgi:hypothetical protein